MTGQIHSRKLAQLPTALTLEEKYPADFLYKSPEDVQVLKMFMGREQDGKDEQE